MLVAYQIGGYYARCTRWHYWLDHLGCHHHCCTSPVGRRLAKPSEQPVQCWKTCCTGSGRAGHVKGGVLSFTGYVGNAMNEDAISELTAELRDILRKRAPDITWHTVHCDHDHEGVLWVRVRAMRTERLVQFVLLVLDSEGAKTTAIAARIIGEALRLLRNKN